MSRVVDPLAWVIDNSLNAGIGIPVRLYTAHKLKSALRLTLRLGACLMVGVPYGCSQKEAAPVSTQITQAATSDYSMDRAFVLTHTNTSPQDLARFSVLPQGENTTILDQTLSRIFTQPVANAGEREVIAALSYVAQVLKLKFSAQHLGSAVLADGQAYCYGISRAFEALCRRLGLPARINSVHNFEYMQAHNMVEVFYDGQWHLFDPTYGTFFYDRDTYDGSGRIPAARELFSGSVSGQYAFMACEQLWTGFYVPGQVPRPLPADFRYRGAFTLRELYDRVLSVGFPFIQSDMHASSFPVNIDMGEARLLTIGTVDGAVEDVEGRRDNASYPRYHGAAYLGYGSTGSVFHTVTIKSALPGRYKMTYHFMRGSQITNLGIIELRDIIADKEVLLQTNWSLEFRLQSAEGIFLVVNRDGLAVVDAITVERLE